MPMTSREQFVSAILVVACVATGCSRSSREEVATGAQPAAKSSPAAQNTNGPVARPAPDGLSYPEPRFPSYLKPPKSIDDMLPAVRVLVRNKSGFLGKG